MKLGERAQKIANSHGHEWMAERIVELEDKLDSQILTAAWIQDDKERYKRALIKIESRTLPFLVDAEEIAEQALGDREELSVVANDGAEK